MCLVPRVEEHCLALDQSLRHSLSWGLAALQPALAVESLDTECVRDTIEAEDLPEELQSDMHGRLCRNGIHNEKTEETRLEYAVEVDAPWLLIVCDQAAPQWSAYSYLTYVAGLRCMHIPDMYHRRSNDCKNAVTQCGVGALKLSAVICLNYVQGPWGEHAHFGKLTQCLASWARTADIDDPLFILAYESLAHDMHEGDVPSSLGSAPHRWEVFNWVASNPALSAKGETVKSNRWHNFPARADALRTSSATLVFLGVLLGMQTGVFKTVLDTPYAGAAMTELPDGGALQDARARICVCKCWYALRVGFKFDVCVTAGELVHVPSFVFATLKHWFCCRRRARSSGGRSRHRSRSIIDRRAKAIACVCQDRGCKAA
eukprot:4897321-Amphidinium_carterae.1